MDLVTVAMASLRPKLVELLKDEYKLQEGVKKDVESLSRDLGMTHASLYKVAEEVPRDLLGERVRIWANNIRELSYDMEDVVDGFLVHPQGSETASSTEALEDLMKKMTGLFEKGKTHHQIAHAIANISKDQVPGVVAHGEAYRVDVVVAPADPATMANIFDPSFLLDLCKDQKEIVGIEGARDELVRRLIDGHDDDDASKKHLKTLALFGFDGLGKTTLAKAVYDCLRVQFDYGAFVRVGHSTSMKKVFKDILTELQGYESASMLDESQLLDKLRGLLEKKRYFIVIDDICDIKSWQTITSALTYDSGGGIIITTTGVFDVATKASDVFKLDTLPHENSEKMFYKKIFVGKDKCPSDQPSEVPNKILHKCGGVPLAIITIARLLACKPREDWEKVYNSIGFGYEENEDVDSTSKILLFCYYDLPHYLRVCLLHLSTYPRNYMIAKESLIWKWVAEGLINEEPGMGSFELGERYFNELINRNMIQPEEIPYKGIIHACRVNDTVHDMICSLANKESLVTTVDSNKTYTPPKSNARRLAIHHSDLGQDPLASVTTSQVRSFHATMCHFSSMPSLSTFQKLRVLAIEECNFMKDQSYHLENLGMLLQLRYLGLPDTPIRELPEEVGHLRFLQALDLSRTSIQELPSSVGLLRQLKCLLTSVSLVGVLDWVGNLTALEELSFADVSECPNFMEDLCKLTELRKLSIVFQGSSSRILVESLCKLEKIQVLNLRLRGFGRSSTGCSWDGYVPPRGLRDLRIKIWSSRLPPWINSSLLPGLTHLKVRVGSLETADLEVLGGLPELVVLRLSTPPDSVPFPPANGGAGAGALFPKLRYCKMDLPLKFPPGAMPCLESLQFRVDLLCLRDAGFDFDELSSLENLHCLERVSVYIYSMEAHERDFVKADTALRHGVHVHVNHPLLEIDCDYEYDEDSSDDDGSDPDETDQDEETNDEDEDEEEEYTHARCVRRRSS